MSESHIEPSAFGFRCIRPKTRDERFNLRDKVSLEKNRINQRVGWQARMHQQNAPETSALLTSCSTGAAGYISNSDRFHTDTVGDESVARRIVLEKQKQAGEFRRQQATKRDENRWNEAEAKANAQEEYWRKLREDGSKAKKNTSNVAYDITTLQYNQDTDGEQQKYYDDMVRYRADLRSNALVVKGDTRARYNIISGEDRQPLRQPAPIPKPSSMVSNGVSPRVDRRMSTQQCVL